VRAAAKVLERPFGVQRHVLARRNAADDLGLVLLAHGEEVLHRLVARQHATRDRLVLRGKLRHALFDRLQVLRRERPLVGEVVIEAVLDHRTDRDLRVGEEILHRIGQQVRRRMADHVQAFRILGRQDREPGVLRHPVAGVHDLAVDLAGKGRLGQAGTDRGGDFGHRNRLRELALRAVGKRDVDHGGCGKAGKQKSAGSAALLGGCNSWTRDYPATSGP
jgi:hypothetical protein